jgi:hypothetical protein
MRKLGSIIIVGILLSLAVSVGANSTPIKLFFNGEELETEVPPEIIDEHLLVPLTEIAEQLDTTVEWDDENNTVQIEAKERAALKAQIQGLEEALAPKDPMDAVATWAEGVKSRNGALQYAVMTPALKAEKYPYFAHVNWSTGVSSPWIDSYEVTESYRVDEGKYRFTVKFNYTDSTKTTFTSKAYVKVENFEEKWLVSALEPIEAKGEITRVTLDDNQKVRKFFVQANAEDKGSYDKANVIIGEKTKIYKGYTDHELPVSALHKGVQVEVMFTDDPRTMIYPVTAVAKTIRVFEPTTSSRVIYENSKYGFTFSLPTSWQRYQTVKEEWEGLSLEEGENEKVAARGLLLKIRHPLWTKEQPRQDIPIMILTLDQWVDLQAAKFHIGAAPIGPKELGRNDKYVFALPARYNLAFLTGHEEVEAILTQDALASLQIR